MLSLPYNKKAEEAILGLMLVDYDCLVEGLSKLTRDHFYHVPHNIIFNNLVILFNSGVKVDLITLIDQLGKTQSLDAVGGELTITDLAETSITSTEFDSYLDILQDKFLKRQAIQAADNIIKRGMKDEDTTEAFSQFVTKSLWDISPSQGSRIQIVSSGNISNQRREDIQKQRETQPIFTDYSNLDKILVGGFSIGDISVMAGRPGMGKSAFKTNLIKQFCERKLGVISFGLEQGFSIEQARLESLLTEIPLGEIVNARNWEKGDYRLKLLAKANKHMDENWNYHIIPSRSINISDVRNILYQITRQRKVDIVFFDLFDKLVDVNVANNKAQNVGVKLGELARLAEEFSVHINCLVQINRRIDARTEKRPNISDLKDSGSYEEMARLILLLYREQYYFPDSLNNSIEVIIAKQNNGPNGTALFDFNESTLEVKPEINEMNIFDAGGAEQ